MNDTVQISKEWMSAPPPWFARMPRRRFTVAVVALLGTVAAGRDLSAGLSHSPAPAAASGSESTPQGSSLVAPAYDLPRAEDDIATATRFPLPYELPPEGYGQAGESVGIGSTGSAAYTTRLSADEGNGPVLIPALPAWAVGGASLAAFAPFMKSRRLWRRLLR